MSSDNIFLAPYDFRWPKLADDEKQLLRSQLPNIKFEIEHIGSTAIPGLAAKPIIDLLVGVDSIADAASAIEPLEHIGYSFWRDNPNKWHFYFVKGLPLAGGPGRTHHVHIVEMNTDYYREKVLFRDYIRANPESAQAYLDLKSELALKYPNDREAYTNGKTEFINVILAKAKAALVSPHFNLSFRPITRQDFFLIQKWLSEPHVKKWWHDDLDENGVESKYGPRVDGIEPTHVYVILREMKPIGLIQWYLWSDYPAHATQLGAENTAAGIDLAIGEKEQIGKGVGSAVISEFVKNIVFANPGIKSVVTDPEEENVRSLKAFEKAGFFARKTTQLRGENFKRRIVALYKDSDVQKNRSVSTDKRMKAMPSVESSQFIITGCPGSGKTTLIKCLRSIGFTCVDEPARQVIAEQRAIQGEGLSDRNVMLFTELLLSRSLESYNKHKGSSAPIIFDRGIPDVIGYAKLFGLDSKKFKSAAETDPYNKFVFIAPPWKEIYSTDDERKMTFDQTAQFHEILTIVYLSLGYELIELPLESVEKRAQFIASFLQDKRFVTGATEK